MKLFNFNKSKKATKAKKDKPKKEKRGFFGKKDKDDFIKKMGISVVVEASFVDDLRDKVADAEQPYIQIDPEGHIIYLLGLTNKLIKGTTLETDSEALGALTSAMENANKRGDCAGSITNATFDTDLTPVVDNDGLVPPSQVVFLPTVNTLNELQNIAGKDQEFEVVCIPSDITANNYNDYLQQGKINCPIIRKDATKDMDTEEATMLVTIPEFKEFVKKQTTLDSTNSYNDEEMGIKDDDDDDLIDKTTQNAKDDDELDSENGDDSSIPTFSDDDDDGGFGDFDDQPAIPNDFDNNKDDGFDGLDDNDDGFDDDDFDAKDDDFDSNDDDGFDDDLNDGLDGDLDGLDDEPESPAEFQDKETKKAKKKAESKAKDKPKADKSEADDTESDDLETNEDKSDSDNILDELSEDNSLDKAFDENGDDDLDVDPDEPIVAEPDKQTNETNDSEPVITEKPQVTAPADNKPVNTGQSSEGTVANETSKPVIAKDEQAVEIKAPTANPMPTANNAVPKVNEGETLIDMKNPDSAFAKIDPNIKKSRSLSDSNRTAREQLRNEFGHEVDKWLNAKLKAPKLWINDSASYGKKFLVQMNLYNDALNLLVQQEREKVKSSIMQQIDTMIDMVTDPAEFDQIFESASKKLHQEFLDKERMQQEIVDSMNQINQDYDELHEALLSHAQDEAEKEYQTKYIPERDQELTQAESKVKNKHHSLYEQAVDTALAHVRKDVKPLIKQHLNELMAQNQVNLDQAGLAVSSQTRTYMNSLLGQATIDAEMSRSVPATQQTSEQVNDPVAEATNYQHEQELNSRDKQIAQLTQRLRDEENRRKDVEAVNATTREQLNQIQAENVKYRRESLDAQNQVQRNERETKSMADQIEDLKRQLSDKDQTAEELMKSKAKLVDSNQQLGDELKNIKSHGWEKDDHKSLNSADINKAFTPQNEQTTENQQTDRVITTPIQPVEDTENKDLPKSGPVHSPQL